MTSNSAHDIFGKERVKLVDECLFYIGSRRIYGIKECFWLQIEYNFLHEESTFVDHLAMEKDFQFGTELVANHAEDQFLFHVGLNFLRVESYIESKRLHKGLATAADW